MTPIYADGAINLVLPKGTIKNPSVTKLTMTVTLLGVADGTDNGVTDIFFSVVNGSVTLNEQVPFTVVDVPLRTPELDPGSLGNALALLVGGVVTLAGRRRRR